MPGRGPASRDGGLAFRDRCRPAAAIDVMIDFSLPPAVPAVTECCRDAEDSPGRRHDRAGPGQRPDLERAATEIPILIAPNMSRAVNLLMKLVGEAARSLG